MCQFEQGHCPLDVELDFRPNALSAEVKRLAGLVEVQHHTQHA